MKNLWKKHNTDLYWQNLDRNILMMIFVQNAKQKCNGMRKLVWHAIILFILASADSLKPILIKMKRKYFIPIYGLKYNEDKIFTTKEGLILGFSHAIFIVGLMFLFTLGMVTLMKL